MAIDFPTSPTTGQVYTYAGVTYVYSAQGVWVTAGASAVGIIGGAPQGRLTLQTATPVMTTTQSAKTMIYYTPYVGNRVPLYDDTSMAMTTFTELSVATTDTTKSPAAIGASKVNDWFVWSDAGTLRLGHGPDWTSDTARSAGTALVLVNGIWLNNASITNGPAASRGTYVGTTRSNASLQLDWIYGAAAAGGTAGVFGVWNAYNRVGVGTVVSDNTDGWTYALTTIRAANASSTVRVSMVRGLDEDSVDAEYVAMLSSTTNGYVSIGIDSTSAFSGVNQGGGTGGTLVPTTGKFAGTIGLGFHYVQALEACQAAATVTFYGDVAMPMVQTGLVVQFRA